MNGDVPFYGSGAIRVALVVVALASIASGVLGLLGVIP